MKLVLSLIIMFLSIGNTCLAQEVSIQIKRMRFKKATFAELYFHTKGESLVYKESSLDQEAKILVAITFSNDMDTIRDEYVLNHYRDSVTYDFFDIKRYSLELGTYDCSITVQDLNRSDNKKVQIIEKITFDQSFINRNISDILLIKNYTQIPSHPSARHGLLLEPLPFQLIDSTIKSAVAYVELYKSKKTISYVVYGMMDMSGNTQLKAHKNVKGNEIEPLLLSIDVRSFNKGDYKFFVRSFDVDRKELNRVDTYCKKLSNPEIKADIHVTMAETFIGGYTLEELNYHLLSLFPVIQTSKQKALKQAIETDNVKRKQFFLLGFWRGMSESNPDTAFHAYNDIVKEIDKRYKSAGLYGFEMDRGYMYLKYGPPGNIIPVDNEPDAPPYEIWVYDNFPTGEVNVRFLFYNPSLVHNDFQLLHGTSRDEKQTRNWHRILYKNVSGQEEGANHHDAERVKDGFGRFAFQYFNDY